MSPFLATPLYLFIVSYIVAQAGYFTYRQITTGITRRRIIEEHGCELPRSFDAPSWFPYLYRLKFIRMIRSDLAERRLLEAVQRRYQEHGNTHSAKVRPHQ